MLLFCLRKDQNVIQVHYDNPFCYDGSEDVVHHSLEGGSERGKREFSCDKQVKKGGDSSQLHAKGFVGRRRK